jgi:hypothetical protein
MAIRGDSPVQIKLVAGHTSFDMTQKYIAAAGAVDLLAGEKVFPELPASLLEAPQRSAAKGKPWATKAVRLPSQNLSQEPQVLDITVEAPGIEPSQKVTIQHESSAIGDHGVPGKATQSDAKCAIAHEPVTARDSSKLVLAALAAALERASVAGEWALVEKLLEALKRHSGGP